MTNDSDLRARARALLAAQAGEAHAEALLEPICFANLSSGEVLLQDQGPVDKLYLLLEGRLSIAVEVGGHSVELGELEPGNWVGEVALFTGSDLADTKVTAATDVKLAYLPFPAFRDLARSAPEATCQLTHTLIGMLIQRLRATIDDPVLEPGGKLLMSGKQPLSLPAPGTHHGVLEFLKNLLGDH